MKIDIEKFTTTFDLTENGDRYMMETLRDHLKSRPRHRGEPMEDDRIDLDRVIAAQTKEYPCYARPIGVDWLPACFITGMGGHEGKGMNMANTCIVCEPWSAPYICALFGDAARIDYIHGDRAAPQVKVGVCDVYLPSLKFLQLMVSTGRSINAWLVQEAKELQRK